MYLRYKFEDNLHKLLGIHTGKQTLLCKRPVQKCLLLSRKKEDESEGDKCPCRYWEYDTNLKHVDCSNKLSPIRLAANVSIPLGEKTMQKPGTETYKVQ